MTASPLVLALGDSLIAGYGLPRADGFPARLQQRLRLHAANVRVVDAGVSGDTTVDVARRMPRILSGLDVRPSLAIVQVGPNDVIRGIPAARTRFNLDVIVAELDRCGIPVLLTTVTPPAFLRQRAEAYMGIHDAVAARHGATVWPFFPPGILGRADMVLADRVHPNAAAIAAVVDAMLPVVERLLCAGGDRVSVPATP